MLKNEIEKKNNIKNNLKKLHKLTRVNILNT